MAMATDVAEITIDQLDWDIREDIVDFLYLRIGQISDKTELTESFIKKFMQEELMVDVEQRIKEYYKFLGDVIVRLNVESLYGLVEALL